MSKQQVTGKTRPEVREMEAEFEQKPKAQYYEFDEYYCLFQIPYQPEDYDGRPRFCSKPSTCNDTHRCRYHVQWAGGEGKPENLEDPNLANLKHGAYASMDTIRQTMDEQEQELYDEVLSWAETYHIDKEEDPSTWDDLVMLAGERVRQLRTQEWILENGEETSKPVFAPSGEIVERETMPAGLAEEHRRITQMVMGLKRDLGLTRKERLKQDAMDTASESANALAETVGALIGDTDDQEYDPSEYEFDPNEDNADGGDAEDDT